MNSTSQQQEIVPLEHLTVQVDSDNEDDDVGTPVAVAAGPMESGVVRMRKPGRRWTTKEDIVLKELVLKNGKKHWKLIAKEFSVVAGTERSDVQCLHRWNKCLRPGLVKGPWTPEEDETIRRMIDELGGAINIRWNIIAKLLPGRLGKQVRERWINHLDPNLKKSEWNQLEDQTLIDLHGRFGNRWKWISEMIPGRSENAVKNRWHSIRTSINARSSPRNQSNVCSPLAVPSSSAATSTQSTSSLTKIDPSQVENNPSYLNTDLASPMHFSEISKMEDLGDVAKQASSLLQLSNSYREMAKMMILSQPSMFQSSFSPQVSPRIGNSNTPTNSLCVPTSPMGFPISRSFENDIMAAMKQQINHPKTATTTTTKTKEPSPVPSSSMMLNNPTLFQNYLNMLMNQKQEHA